MDYQGYLKIKDTIKKAIDDGDVVMTTFCSYTGISEKMWQQWQNSRIDLPDKKIKKVKEYLQKYVTGGD